MLVEVVVWVKQLFSQTGAGRLPAPFKAEHAPPPQPDANRARSSVSARASEELSKCRRTAQPCCLLMIDLDHFKRVNDTYGHASGDEALRQLARIARSTLRDFDMFGRIGGEEFAVMLSAVDVKQAVDIGNRLREAMSAQTITHEAKQFRITLSGGVVRATDQDSVESLLEAADAALYRAKNTGRNRIEVATP